MDPFPFPEEFREICAQLLRLIDQREQINIQPGFFKRRLADQHDSRIHQTADRCATGIDQPLIDDDAKLFKNFRELENTVRIVDFESDHMSCDAQGGGPDFVALAGPTDNHAVPYARLWCDHGVMISNPANRVAARFYGSSSAPTGFP